MTPKTDFDEITGKLGPVPPPELATLTAALIKAAPPRGTVLGFAPSGSPPGKPNSVDAARTAIAGFTVYGALQGGMHFLQFVGLVAPGVLPRYGPEIAAVAVALYHLGASWLSDNTPRAEPLTAGEIPSVPRLP